MLSRFMLCVPLLAARALVAQVAWTQVGATAPPPRQNMAWSYDAGRDRVVMFGGWTSQPLNDTWEWDGTTWTQATPATPPAPRAAAAMAFDPLIQRTVLFGGGVDSSGNTTLADTWEWDGTNWTQVTSAVVPPNRFAHDLAFYLPLGGVVMFGGRTGLTGLSDTWLYRGQAWIPLSPANAPSGRCCFAMGYDAQDHLVLFGGWLNVTLGDTWVFDGTNWVQRQRATAPSARWGHKMAYDRARRRLVSFSGSSAPNGAGTWEWDGTDWIQRLLPTEPPGRTGHLLAFMEARGQSFMWGGAAGRVDAWNYGPVQAASFAMQGAGCPGSNLAPPRLDALGLPYAGNPWSLQVANARANAAALILLGRQAANISLAGSGAPGCTLYEVPVLWVSLVLGPFGDGTLPLPIPSDPGLAGAQFYAQAVVHDPTVNALGLVVSNGGIGVIRLP